MRSATEAVADAWASIDGKTDAFRKGRDGDDEYGAYQGYMSDASELIRRLEDRGFMVVRK